MNKFLFHFFLYLIVVVTTGNLADAQALNESDLEYDVQRVYPPLSLTQESLAQAKVLVDINAYYKPKWVKEYISVELHAQIDGVMKIAESNNDTLTAEQIKLISASDPGSKIYVDVRYVPQNNLMAKEEKTFDFDFFMAPEQSAEYPGGEEKLLQYFKERAIDKIVKDSFQDYDLAALKFTINEDGEVHNPSVYVSKNDSIDAVLVSAIEKMPCWQPATYSDGSKIEQEFVLLVGSMQNCMINTLNIDPVKEKLRPEN